MKDVKKVMTLLAVAGNLILVLWILYNGINEGFKGTLPEKASYISLLVLLALNSFLLLGKTGDSG